MMKESNTPKWRYRLQLISERKDRPVFSFSMPVWVTALLALLTTLLTVLLVIIVMTRTPLRQYLPGYLDVTKRAEVMEAAMRLDSLSRENELRNVYLQQIIAVLDGEVKADSIAPFDSSLTSLQDTIIAKSQREEDFVNQYQHRERFGIDALDSKMQQQTMAWIVPVKGKVILSESTEDDTESLVVKLAVEREVSVLSPVEGTIINQQFIIGQGWEQTLMAGNEYVIVLSHLSMVLGDIGRQVKAGTAISHVGGQKDAEDRWMSIRIWHKGKPLDPASVIVVNR